MSFELDESLLKLSPHDNFSWRDAFAHTHVFGATGSGKSSGPGKTLASAFLRAGAGFLVTVTKYEEVETWLDYAKRNGRSKSIIRFDESRGFNFIQYELARNGVKALGAVVEYIMEVLAAADHAAGAGGKEGDEFWSQAVRQLLQYCLPLLYSATGTVTVGSIIDFVASAATDAKQYVEPGFAERSFAARILRQVVDCPKIPIADSEQRMLLEYWFISYPAIPSKTLGNIVISLSAKLDRFRHGRLRDCFCAKTDIVPEMSFSGGIILLDMPAQTWNADGVIGQKLFKAAWQRAVLARNSLEPRLRERPTVLWSDESQTFVTSTDHAFLSTCRASRCAVVYLSQTLVTYFAELGPGRQDAASALVGKFATQIYCANACTHTNKLASDTIGRGIQYRATQGSSVGRSASHGMNEGASTNRGFSSNSGSSYGSGGGSHSSGSGSNNGSGESYGTNVGRGTNSGENWSRAEHLDNIIEPRRFTELKTGGPANRNLVTAILFKAGAAFKAAQGNNFLHVTFKQ